MSANEGEKVTNSGQRCPACGAVIIRVSSLNPPVYAYNRCHCRRKEVN